MRPSFTFPQFIFVILACHAAATAEEVRVTDRDEFARALATAKPGTTIFVAPGTYRGGLSRAGLRGTKDRPIVIAGSDPKNPPVIEGGGNAIQLSSPQHVVLRDFIFSKATGNGLNIDDGGADVDAPAQHVVLKNLVVHDVGPGGNRDGIKLSGVSNFRVENCRALRWGSGGSAIDMVGCHDGVITGCTFAEATGDGANGVQAKGGSSQIVIQRCRFENAGGRAVNLGGSTGLPYFRPRDAKYEAQDITVEDCTFLGGMSAIAFVGVDGAVVQHNTIYRPTRWAIRILQESTADRFVPCRNGRFVKNIVVFQEDEARQIVNIGGNTAPETFEFAANHWHCLDRPANTQRLVQLPTPEKEGIYAKPPGFKDAASGELQIPGRKSEDAGVRDES
ncbi:MAG TPA: right-handed parallel beta-helix repeat-containing protein [Pirellulaceae bacterium]|nr:right-handed parallel beta-helix repeat-containing protein [Pirellulaceae bacterium]